MTQDDGHHRRAEVVQLPHDEGTAEIRVVRPRLGLPLLLEDSDVGRVRYDPVEGPDLEAAETALIVAGWRVTAAWTQEDDAGRYTAPVTPA